MGRLVNPSDSLCWKLGVHFLNTFFETQTFEKFLQFGLNKQHEVLLTFSFPICLRLSWGVSTLFITS